jgi:hypothetical protein
LADSSHILRSFYLFYESKSTKILHNLPKSTNIPDDAA